MLFFKESGVGNLNYFFHRLRASKNRQTPDSPALVFYSVHILDFSNIGSCFYGCY